jgi:hypothetical protein
LVAALTGDVTVPYAGDTNFPLQVIAYFLQVYYNFIYIIIINVYIYSTLQ